MDNVHPIWDNFQNLLKEKVQSEGYENFLKWDFIYTTMFHIPDPVVLKTLQNSNYWNIWKEALNRDEFGNPPNYNECPNSDGNTIHHTYSLLQLANFMPDFDINKYHTIYEFGGGYGNLCKIIHRLGFKGTYIIQDLPEFSKLQKNYLEKVGIDTSQIWFVSSVETPINVDLFISLWAIDEVPSNLRETVLNNIKTKEYLLAYNDGERNKLKFNNFGCLTSLTNANSDYSWKNYEIKHLPTNYYLLGRRND